MEHNHESEEPVECPDTGGSSSSESASGAPSPEVLADLKDRAAKSDQHYDAWMRVLADLQNLQRRALRDKEQARRMAVRDLVRALIPSFDNLDRALSASAPGASDALLQGVTMVNKEIWRVLAENGVTILDPVGAPLDPNLHEAISSRPEPGTPANTVLEVWERGYALGDMIIRPARVTVACEAPLDIAPPDSSASE